MRNLKLTIEYHGKHFHGWQIQAKGERTVQGELTKAFETIFGKTVTVIGAGRTDSGVHARGQVANVKIATDKPCLEILKALNANTAKDVVVLDVRDVPQTFHAQHSAISKLYRYIVLNRPIPSPLAQDISLYYPYKLNLTKMRKQAKYLIGKKDFRSFRTSNPGQKKEDTVRTIKRLDIKRQGDYVQFDVEADGFLYKMVRNIVGTLLEIGRGKLTDDIPHILKAHNRACAGDAVKPQGLALVHVTY